LLVASPSAVTPAVAMTSTVAMACVP
jgi:hypothetical protein